MNFVSFAFAAMMFAALAARATIGMQSNAVPYLLVLLVLSLIFYGWHRPSYLLLLLFNCVIDYVAGLVLARDPRERIRRAVLIISLTANLGMLAFFKYATFLIESALGLLSVASVDVGWHPAFHVVLPIGISFYTFQSMSYTIDVYRGELRRERSFWRFLLFVAFFPQLVVGPIVRASEFLYQFRRPRQIHLRVTLEALGLVLRGFFLKMVCADNIGAYLGGPPGLQPVWDVASQPGADAHLAWFALALFSVQIYCDFAGYSDIARGTAYLLGFRLPLNFNYPYIARSFSEFWRRWHISLSTWLRDYLYIPLGGNRAGAARTYANLVVVMLLGGLWHGAAWTFAVWGAIHGAALAVERLLGIPQRLGQASGPLMWAWSIPYYLVVQLVVALAWVYFRSDSLAEANQFVANLFGGPTGALDFSHDWPQFTLLLIGVVAAMHGRAALRQFAGRPLHAFKRAAWAALMLYATLSFYGRSNDSIYFQS
ncbi:MAG: MBOAT family O-acyltransferase [Acidobacteriota bacterium]